DDAVHSVLECNLRIFSSDNSLEDQLHFGGVFQALHEIPGEAVRVQTCSLRDIQSIEHGCAADVAGKAAFVTGGAIAIVDAACAGNRLPVAVVLKIDGEHQHRAACGLGSLDDGAR